nr:hypothetical protein [Tanacetum cinerariifolium]
MIKKEKSEKLGRVSTEMELMLELTQQGISHEVSVASDELCGALFAIYVTSAHL